MVTMLTVRITKTVVRLTPLTTVFFIILCIDFFCNNKNNVYLCSLKNLLMNRATVHHLSVKDISLPLAKFLN